MRAGLRIQSATIQFFISLNIISNEAWPAALKFATQNSIYSGAIAMMGGLIVVPIVSLISKKMDSKETDKMFECFDEKVTVAKKEALD